MTKGLEGSGSTRTGAEVKRGTGCGGPREGTQQGGEGREGSGHPAVVPNDGAVLGLVSGVQARSLLKASPKSW